YRWSKGYLFKDGPSRGYSRTLRNTSRYLEENGFTTYNFDVHAPIEYNSEKFIDISNHLDKGKQEFSGMVTASIYGNVYGFKPMPYTDVVLTSLRYTEDFDRMETNQMFATSNAGFGNGVKEYLEALFPNKSK